MPEKREQDGLIAAMQRSVHLWPDFAEDAVQLPRTGLHDTTHQIVQDLVRGAVHEAKPLIVVAAASLAATRSPLIYRSRDQLDHARTVKARKVRLGWYYNSAS
jgi:hypothetical protein